MNAAAQNSQHERFCDVKNTILLLAPDGQATSAQSK